MNWQLTAPCRSSATHATRLIQELGSTISVVP
jgi:hypothetical protein